MTDFYTGPGGIDTATGRSWALRRLTITGGLAAGLASGDRLYVGPGVYREKVVLGGHGEIHSWTGGTVSVTHNSKIVTGESTNWLPGIWPGDTLFIPWLASGTDGIGNGAGGFTSASNPFEATYLGFCINIETQGSYKIATFVGVNSITLTDVNVVGWPGAGPNNFWVPSNEGSYEIESVDSDTQITLVRPWSGPTCAFVGGAGTEGLDYEIWRPMYLIGDETGAHTDGVGGVCRITGSTDDQTVTETDGIDTNEHSYWTIRGFQIDSTSNNGVYSHTSDAITLEDLRILDAEDRHIYIQTLVGDNPGGDRTTVRRCSLFGGLTATGIEFDDAGMADRWDRVNHIENIYAACYRPFYVEYRANTTIKNCTNGMNANIFLQTVNISLGGCVFIHDCEIHYCSAIPINDGANGQVLMDWCSIWDSNPIGGPFMTNGTAGANCEEETYLYLPDLPRLVDNYRYPVRFYPPSQWWGVAFQGLYAANEDIYGVPKPVTDTKLNWGPQQTHYIERDVATVYGGEEASMEHVDARTTQFRIASSGSPVTVTAFVRRETNYAGTLPRLVVHQAGNTDVETTATGAVDTWEQLSVSYTPNAQPPIIWASVVTDNTAGAGNYAVYWQLLSDTLT